MARRGPTYPSLVPAPSERLDSRVVALAIGALVAFSANSILARLALGGGLTDAASYGTIRIASGALTLAVILRARRGSLAGSWVSALLLALYAAPFSFAYLELTAGTGALILFGSVQATMIGTGVVRGDRPSAAEWLGLFAAVAGLVWLVSPGVDRAPLSGAVLMAVAGVAWGGYSLRGRRATDPLAATAGNFLRALPFMLVVSAVAVPSFSVTTSGVGYAVLSGAVASGLGYVVWYAALPGLTATRASIIQLAVPALTAWAGVLILAEDVTLRLVLAGTVILGGVALATFGWSRDR